MPSVRVSSHLPTYTFSPICMGRSNIARPTGLLLARVLPIPQQSPRATQPKVMELIWRGQIRDLFHRCVPPDCGTPPYRGTAPYRSTGALLRRGTPTLTAVRASYYDAVRQPYRDAVRQLYRDTPRRYKHQKRRELLLFLSHLGRTNSIPSPYQGRFILGFCAEIRTISGDGRAMVRRRRGEECALVGVCSDVACRVAIKGPAALR